MASRNSSRDKKKPKDKKVAAYKAASSNPIVQNYLTAINRLANGDKAVGQGLVGGAELGAELFGPGKLGRLDESGVENNADVKLALDTQREQAREGVPPELTNALQLAQNAVGNSDINSGINQDTLARLREATGSSTDQTAALNLLRSNAENAGQQTDLETEILNLRRAGLGGMGTRELTALKEGGGYDAQGNFIPGASAIQRAAKSALSGLQANNLVSGGPKGRSSLINSAPIIQNVLDQTGTLQRKLILDEYNSKLQAENQFTDDASKINTGIQDRVGTFSSNYGTAANNAQSIAATASNNLGNFVQGTNQNFVNATGNYGTTAGTVETSRANRLNTFLNTVGNIRNENLYRQTFNMSQLDREAAGMSSSIFGGGAFGASQAGRKEANDIAKRQLEAAKSFGGGGNSGWSGNGNTASGSNGTSTAVGDTFDVSM